MLRRCHSATPRTDARIASILPLVLFLIPFILFAASPAAARGRAYVLVSGALIAIDIANPAAGGTPVTIAGIAAGDVLVGIDVRPQNGFLYGLGYNQGAGTVQLYAISARTGQATPVGTSGMFVATDGTTPVAITGTNFGMDFDPVADRLRVVNDARQNFRMDPNTGAFVDGDLGGATAVPGLNMDGTINGASTSVTGVAYTNNHQNAVATTLYALDGENNALSIQNTPLNGTQATAVIVRANGITLDFAASIGFDMLPDVDVATNNDVAAGTGFAALTVSGVTSLYTINLTTSAATLIGPIGDGTSPVQGLALAGEAVGGGLPSIALTATNDLIRFNTGQAATATTVNVTGLVAGETLVGIDWRPQVGQLMALGFNQSDGTGSSTLYRLDPQTGIATIVGSPHGVADGTGTPIHLTAATAFAFDIDPTTDRIRVVGTNNLNLQFDPNTGALAAVDTTITSNAGLAASITGAAYTNSFGQALTGTTTTLYTLDTTYHSLYVQNPPSGGLQTRRLIIGGSSALLFSAVNGFDIPAAVRVDSANASADGQAYAVLEVAAASKLYKIDLNTAEATLIGAIGNGLSKLSGLAVGDGPRLATRTTVSSSANPSLIGQTVTFTATVSPSTATGTVDFAGYFFQSCQDRPIAAGIATCTIHLPVLGPGLVTFVASYSGDEFHFASSSPTFVQNITLSPTTTSVSVSPGVAHVGQDVTLVATVTPAGVTGTVTFNVDGAFAATVPLLGGVATIAIPTLSMGLHSVTALFNGNSTHGMSLSAAAALVMTKRFAQYFAEGATGFFQTDIGILNASKTDWANVNVTLLPEAGTPFTLLFALPPLGRRTIDVNEMLGPTQGVSTLVSSERPIGAMRLMTWGEPVYGSTLESGISETSATWYFAEGATNVFSLFYLIQNPGPMDATVTLTHLLEGGAEPVVQTAVVPAFSRRTLFINDVPGLAAAALSTVITSTVPIVAERAMYLNTAVQPLVGGTAGRGAMAPSKTWSFAEGATGFFRLYLLLGNPNVDLSTVAVQYQMPDGTTIDKSYDVPGRSRRTVDVNAEDPLLASAAVGMSLTSSVPIVAERAMWWGEPFIEGTVALGSTTTGTVWAVGEVGEGGTLAESTFVLVSNGSANAGTVRFTVVYDDGSNEQRDYDLLGSARLTVRIGDDFARADDVKFSVLVESLTPGVPITVEAARYQSGHSILGAGGAAPATRIQ